MFVRMVPVMIWEGVRIAELPPSDQNVIHKVFRIIYHFLRLFNILSISVRTVIVSVHLPCSYARYCFIMVHVVSTGAFTC